MLAGLFIISAVPDFIYWLERFTPQPMCLLEYALSKAFLLKPPYEKNKTLAQYYVQFSSLCWGVII